MHWMLLPLRRYADFSGRSRRMEYWMFSLFQFVVSILLIGGAFALTDLSGEVDAPGSLSDGALLGFVPIILFWLAIGIPSVAVQVRRFHDRDMSGWWVVGFSVLSNIPVVGVLVTIAWLILLILPGTDGPNRFGPDPKNPYYDDTDVFA